MTHGSFRTRAARVLAILAVALVVPACKDDDNSGSPSTTGPSPNTPLQWVQGPNVGGSGGNFTQDPNGDTPILWVDPNLYPNYTPTNGFGVINFTVLRTYGGPTIYADINSTFFNHALRTQTVTQTITLPEDYLMGQINAFRQTQLGGVVVGGGVGGGVGGTTGIILAGHNGAREVNRAHCQDYATQHPFVPLPLQNEEGDFFGAYDPLIYPSNSAGVPATNPANLYTFGRMGKNLYRPGIHEAYTYSGVAFQNSDEVYYDLITGVSYPGTLLTPSSAFTVLDSWTHMSVGHWFGGTESYYWEIAFMYNPNPAF